MVMSTLQIRMNPGLLRRIDKFVKEGIYSNRSEVIRDAVRSLVWKNELGTVPDKGDAVEQIKKARKQLARQDIDLKEIDNL